MTEPAPLGVSGRVARAFLQAQLTPLIALVLLLLGAFAVAVTPKEEEPQINVTMANVLIPFPGASSRDVHNLVAVPAEQVLSQITGVEHLTSVSQPGLAVLTVQFKVGEPRTDALVKLYDTLMSHRDWLPAHLGVLEPVVKPKGIDDVPIVALTLHSTRPDVGAADLERIAHEVETEVKRVPGTREVATIGGPGRVVRVTLDAERMNAHQITVTDIERALRAVNRSLPAGSLTRGNRAVEVRAGEFVRSAAEVGELVVGLAGPARERRPVRLADVAQIADGADTPQAAVWHGAPATGQAGVREFRESPAVTIAVSKKAGANAATVADGVAERVAQLQGQLVPADVVVTMTRNYGATASDKAHQLIKKLIFATLSVVALVWATLGRREAVIVGAAVVLTLAATLFASWAWGFTLNRVSLFALIFSIGILVDDAIVVVENIHRRAQLEHAPLAQVIPRAVDEVGGPTILATLTVIAALLPMAFVSGLMGPYMAPIPINSSLGMLLSLAIAFVITPWLALRLLPAVHAAPTGGDKLALRLGRFFERTMRPFLRGDDGRRARRWLGVGMAATIALSLALVPLGAVVLKMLPFDNKSEFQVVVDMPTGTPVEATAALLRELAAEVAGVPEVSHYQAYAGLAAPINFNGLVRQYYLRRGGEVGDLQVNLVDKGQRHRKSHDIAQAVRPALEAIARRHGADLKVVEVPPGPPVLAPIVAELYGPDAEATMALAKQVRAVFESTADITAVDDTVLDPADRVVLRVDTAKAAQYGIPAAEVTRLIATALGGADVTPLHDGASKYAVPVRIGLADSSKGSLDALLKLRVRGDESVRDAATGLPFEVPLAELVRATTLPREDVYHRKDLQPVVYVTGDVAGGAGKTDSPLYGMFAMRTALGQLATPGGLPLTEHWIEAPGDRYGAFGLKWDGEWQITYETFRDMGLAYAVGLVLIYLLVVAQFRSYVTPLVIMAPIPLTVIGVLPGHALLGAQFTATSMIGMIALAGIIVRNSILLVDFIHQRLDEGADFEQATIDAAATRAKPIVLTALAAMLGALFILDDPIFNGLAISLLFGIFVSTALTLVLIPVLYYALNYRRRQAEVAGTSPSAAAGAFP
jgi:multidrug efflux pump subunit AcrB